MQCRYCRGQDFEKSSYNYYVCKKCGKLYYEEKKGGRKSGLVSELYFTIGVGAVVLIITILILLFVTAASKRESLRSAAENSAVSAEK